MKKIETLKEVQALIGETYMYAVIIAVIALVLAYIIATIIKYGGKNSTDHVTRRVWFIVIGIVAIIAFFLYNALYVSSFIAKAPLQAKFSTSNILATLILLGVYLIIGLTTMLILRRSKWGSILGISKK